ncbi:MAG: porin family protein [Bacteroidota bacterium]
MQDKDFHNQSEFDGAFLDQSWSNMKAMLDKEMPVDSPPPMARGNKNYLLLLLFLVIGFAAGAGAFVVFSNTSDQEPQQPLKRLPIAQSVPIEASKLRSAPPVVNQYNPDDHLVGVPSSSDQTVVPSTNESSSNESTLSLAYANTLTLNTTKAVKSSTPSTNNQTTAVPPADIAVQADIPQADQGQTQPMAPAAAAEAAPAKSGASASFGAMALLPSALPTLASQLIEPAMALVQLPKKKRLRLGMTLAGHLDGKLDGAGYSVGPILEYDLDRKFALRTGVNYTHIQHSGEGASLASFDEVFIPQQSTGGGFSPVNVYTVSRVPTMDYLTVPLLLIYDLGANVKVSAGGELSYLLNAKSTNVTDDFDNFDPDFFPNREENPDVKSNLRKANVAAQVGVGYYPTDNIGFDLSYNFGLVDYTRENAYFRQFDNHKYIKFSLNYYFSRR